MSSRQELLTKNNLDRGTDFLRRPHLYGQTHPFCVANVPIRSAGSEQEMRFVLRVYKGVTADLERVIRAKIAAKGGEECELKVAVEGPFGTHGITYRA